MKDQQYYLDNPAELAALLANAPRVEHDLAASIINSPIFAAWVQQQINTATQFCLAIEHP